MSGKFDRKDAMRMTLGAEKQKVTDRFAMADAVLAERPSGLASPPTHVPAPIVQIDVPELESKQILSVPLSQIHDNPLNARHIYDPEIVKSLAASMATRGQMVPASAIRHPDGDKAGHYILIDGHYRKKSLLAAGKTEMDIILLENDGELELYRLSWLLNEERSSQTALDNAIAWKKLMDKSLVQEGAQIAEILGISPATVNKTLALLKLPQAAIDKIRDHPNKFGVFIGYELTLAAKIIPEVELLALIDKIIAEDLSSREVEAIRGKFEKGSDRKKKEVSRQYKIRHGNAQIGVIKEWDSGKIAFEIKLADPKERAGLLDDLKRRFHLEE
jgi:ParB family chromosome partitioning protein